MRINKYVNILNLTDGSLLLYHQVTKRHIVFEAMPKAAFIQAVEQNQIPDELLSNLTKDYFLVKNEFNEKEELLSPIRNLFLYSNSTLNIVVHLNYDCNLKCSYCYQNVILGKVVMNEKTENEVITFITKLVSDTNPEFIDLNFIGGEPTLHAEKMIRIMQACNQLDSNFYYSAVSNGTFGNSRKLRELTDLGLKEYFITLDGPEKEHDKFRVYQSGKGSFSTVIRNLKKMQTQFPEIKVLLNSNLNEENKNSIPELLDYIQQEGIKYPLVFSEVIDTAVSSFNRTIKKSNLTWLNAHMAAMDRGYKFRPYTREIDLGCSRYAANYYIIGADGFLFSCIEAVGMNEFRQCHISDYGQAVFDMVRSQTQEVEYSSSKCKTCSFLPHCDGGCYYRRSHDDFTCPKQEFEENDIPILKRIFEVKHA